MQKGGIRKTATLNYEVQVPVKPFQIPDSRRSFDLDRAELFGLCVFGVDRDDWMRGCACLYWGCFGVPKLVSDISGDDDQPGCQPPWRVLQGLKPRRKPGERTTEPIPAACGWRMTR